MNLDTTLREKFNNWALNRMVTDSLPNWNECSDWWLAEFHQLMNEKREAIEALAKRKHDDIPSAIEYVYDSVTEETEKVPLEDCSSMEATCYNAGFKDALSILKD